LYVQIPELQERIILDLSVPRPYNSGMNKLSVKEQATVIRGLVEGNSIASLVRMTGIAKTTILRLIVSFGQRCWDFHCDRVHGLNTQRVQMDEVWAFVGAKAQNTHPAKKLALAWGDAWTWTAIDADSKLMISWLVGDRSQRSAHAIMQDVAPRLNNRVQLTTDGHNAYWSAAGLAFKNQVDYAQLVKIFGTEEVRPGKYSPPQCTGIKKEPRIGDPDPVHISTSFAERSNLTVRMGIRRYTRLTNGHSKKIENHIAMTDIFMTCYNWCRQHQTLRVTPAMEAGLTDHIWEVEELLLALLK
jgi:IS1 family transposase